jgi:hypothetical protein
MYLKQNPCSCYEYVFVNSTGDEQQADLANHKLIVEIVTRTATWMMFTIGPVQLCVLRQDSPCTRNLPMFATETMASLGPFDSDNEARAL